MITEDSALYVSSSALYLSRSAVYNLSIVAASFQVSFYPSFQVFLAKGQAKGRLTLNATNGFNFEPGSPAVLLEQ